MDGQCIKLRGHDLFTWSPLLRGASNDEKGGIVSMRQVEKKGVLLHFTPYNPHLTLLEF